MEKIKSESVYENNSDVTIITIESGRDIYCSKWNGEQFNECWEYPNNEDWREPIDLGQLRYIYSEVEDEDGDFEVLGINLE